MGPGMTNWTRATGRVGVGVMVGVRVGRYTGDALKSTVLVVLGVAARVEVWLSARGVELAPSVGELGDGVEVGDLEGKSAGVLPLVGVAVGVEV
jgi:hypothetical protein